MKTILILALCFTATTAFGEDILAKVPGPDGMKTFILNATDATLDHVDWEANDGGGMREIHGVLENDSVILTTTGWNIIDGVRTDESTRIIVPINKIPKEVSIGNMKIELTRVGDEKGQLIPTSTCIGRPSAARPVPRKGPDAWGAAIAHVAINI